MTGPMGREARLFFIALQFLTRVPVPRAVGFEPEWLNASARYFPLVGALVGSVGAGVFAVAAALWPSSVAAGLSIYATLLLTGAFHEDGLADTCDALGGAVSRERALEIMKDSRIGSYGTVGIVVALGLKWAALGAMLPAFALPATIFAHAASRAAPVLLIRCLPYAGDLAQSKAKPMAQRVCGRDVAVALASTAVLGLFVVALAPAHAGALVASGAALAGVTLAAAAWLKKRLGGYTGDCLGATQQLTETVIYLSFVSLLWISV